MRPIAQATEKVTVWHKETGEPALRWPVDARAMVASGDYLPHDPALAAAPADSVVPPEDGPSDPAPAAGLAPALPEGFDTYTKAEMLAFAQVTLGLTLDPTLTKRQVQAAVAAHFAAQG